MFPHRLIWWPDALVRPRGCGLSVKSDARLSASRLAGGEDYGYFASNAGGRRFDSCHGNYARVAQWIEHLCPWSLFPRPNEFNGTYV